MTQDIAVTAEASAGASVTPVATTIPRATARLQVHKGFTLDDAAAIVPYLARMGISHVYTSPILKARPGSMHGYDIVDHTAINPEIGGMDALLRLSDAIRAHGMGLVIDIVPNHMGVGGADNAWWLDVLEWGRASHYAEFFDIDWEPADARLHNRILLPFLGSAYGICLEAGELVLKLDEAAGSLAVHYHEHVFPISPRHYASVFPGFPGGLALDGRSGGMRDAAVAMKARLRDRAAVPEGAANIARALARYDATTAEGQANLHKLLERQHYRLSWWRAAADEINWRRFFDVTSLAGLRAEVPAVFDATHVLIEQLYADGIIDGVRIDHIDGLADPRAYCRKLRRRLEAASSTRPQEAPQGEPYIVVEKILAPHERLPADWRTDGTTGYDFMDQVGRLMHDPAGEAPLTALWCELSGNNASYEAEERAARRLILREALSSESLATAAALHRVALSDLATRDYTLTAIRRAMVEILVHFPVYRLYAGLVGRPITDDRVLEWAMSGARRSVRAADHPLLEQIGQWLGGEAPRALPPGPQRHQRMRAIVRFEQLSSPVAAKSMEDTAFYRYGRLLSRNEVGSNPAQFAMIPAAMHAIGRERQRGSPAAMLATATHDHKRGEDVRARLAVLSEIPEAWGEQLRRWMRLNASLRREVLGGPAPDPADEVMLYEMLVGAWSPELSPDDAEGVQAFAERIVQWQEKALREAKRHTNWIAPDEAYEGACRDFVFQVLDPSRPAKVVQEIGAFAHRIAPAGAANGLMQTLLRLTMPGVPDLYQGAEFWDLSLVDPDNRRPVDYHARVEALNKGGMPDLANWRDGRIKQAVIARVLALRARCPALFAEGRYVPLRVEGPAAEHVIAFARQYTDPVLGEQAVIVAATRLPAALLGEATVPLVSTEAWQNTRLVLPRGLAVRGFRDVLGSTQITAGMHLRIAAMLQTYPVGCYELT
jgi:(1->4)-alpha-D-glucan 1-alpha-D-glucosylmutase